MTLFTYGHLRRGRRRRRLPAADAYAVMLLAAWCALYERTTP